jgi:hypothetical protein
MPRLSAKTQQWFKIPGDADDAELQINHLKPGEVQKIESGTSRWLGKSVNDQFTSELEFDPTTRMRKLRLASVVGWKGFFGLNGEPLECTQVNKALFLDDDPEMGEGEDAKPLSAWIDQFRDELSAKVKPQEEEAEKN